MATENPYLTVTDPLCDEMYAVCDSCRARPACAYFASGQVAQCITLAGELTRDRADGYVDGMDERLERCFDNIIRKASHRGC